jgi:hypothetical protein
MGKSSTLKLKHLCICDTFCVCAYYLSGDLFDVQWQELLFFYSYFCDIYASLLSFFMWFVYLFSFCYSIMNFFYILGYSIT